MKTLYLDGRQHLEVLLDGPALRVRSAGRADGRYPLARVSRVVTLGAVRWQPQALLACFHFQVPIAVLEPSGRFVRIRFPVAAEPGLGRHLGEVLEIARYRRRYDGWLREAERRERADVALHHDVTSRQFRSENVWQAILTRQAGGPCGRVGRHYAYLRGLTMAHAASLLSRIGLPNDAQMWTRQEFRFLNDIVRLEQWRHVDIVSQLIADESGCNRRALTEAFESQAEARERRITSWRQGLLLALLGVWPEVGGHPRAGKPLDPNSEQGSYRYATWYLGDQRRRWAASIHAAGFAAYKRQATQNLAQVRPRGA